MQIPKSFSCNYSLAEAGNSEILICWQFFDQTIFQHIYLNVDKFYRNITFSYITVMLLMWKKLYSLVLESSTVNSKKKKNDFKIYQGSFPWNIFQTTRLIAQL